MSIDWTAANQDSGNTNFVSYAPAGDYEVKLEKVEIRDNPNWKSPMAIFSWQEDEYKYPYSVAHWLSLASPNFRHGHFRAILMELGLSQSTAEQQMEKAEADEDREKMAKAYQALFDRVAQKHPTVKITVRPQVRDGKPVTSGKGTPLTESEFANPRLQLGKKSSKAGPAKEAAPMDDLFGDSEVPF